MSRYYALALIPGGGQQEGAGGDVRKLLYPYAYTPDVSAQEHGFDYVYGQEDLADPTDEGIADRAWPASEILEPQTLAGLGQEALVPPDGAWQESDDPGRLRDGSAWLEEAARCSSGIGSARPYGMSSTFLNLADLRNSALAATEQGRKTPPRRVAGFFELRG